MKKTLKELKKIPFETMEGERIKIDGEYWRIPKPATRAILDHLKYRKKPCKECGRITPSIADFIRFTKSHSTPKEAFQTLWQIGEDRSNDCLKIYEWTLKFFEIKP